MHSKKLIVASIVFGLTAVAAAMGGLGLLQPNLANADPNADDQITVITQNQYLGADLTSVVTAPNPVAFNQAVVAALAQVAANNFPERAQALAKEIANRRPELVGLQEVLDLKLNGENGSPPYRDYLADTLDALAALGLNYVVGASVQNLHLTLPVDFNGDLSADAAISITDRDVILVRADLAALVVPVSFPSCAVPAQDGGPGCHYRVIAQVNTVAGPINIERGFIGVDAIIGGKSYRVVNTHLEVRELDATNPLSAAIQAAQASELIGILAATTPPGYSLIIVGDINSSPADAPSVVGSTTIVPPYHQFSAAGYVDTWTLRRGSKSGFSCCQLPDLSNRRSLLSERIDMIFAVEIPRKVKARVLGARVADKSKPSRLWPSDHAAVVATLKFD